MKRHHFTAMQVYVRVYIDECPHLQQDTVFSDVRFVASAASSPEIFGMGMFLQVSRYFKSRAANTAAACAFMVSGVLLETMILIAR